MMFAMTLSGKTYVGPFLTGDDVIQLAQFPH